MRRVEKLNLALRSLMELGVVLGLGYWGFNVGSTTWGRVALGLGAPMLGFGFWGLVDFHQAGRAAEGLRLLQELVVSFLAAAALYTRGRHGAGWALGGLSAAYHALLYASGGRLLRRGSDPARPSAPSGRAG